jgi:DNA-binding transcriptional ArsR family regulator
MPDHSPYAGREQQADQQADYCRIFGNTRRVMILWALFERELSVGEIAEKVGTTLQNISQHLRLLKDYQLVTSRRHGQTIYYCLNEDVLAQHCQGLWDPPAAVHSEVQAKTRRQE